ncbi:MULTISPECIES: alpha/beta hydrolase [Xanthomonas]|jgi:acetyl esterase|uniref:alpha/beta hydrolase n=1 Tax=Xanthomonas TaxID=338 RepID=UPI0015C6CAE0|nr:MULTISPECIES: alpha/beta hydrolase [Xanthomonas]MBD7923132.1 alpha/beta hydrolase [Xanthomonas surreyensis]MBN6113208.1 alpha/beta hydrolase [Xanthomonas bonasiae]NYF22871.1 acetyl esterase [Xanthomonas sp. JAI131]
MQADPFDPSRLAPDVLTALATMAAAADGKPPLHTLPMPAMRRAYREITTVLGGDAWPMREVRDLQADGPLGPIPLRRYLPAAAAAPSAAIVYLHGGGWILGDLDSHDKVCRRLAHAAGCAVIAVDYRLAPEHPAPAGPEDVLAAIRWLHAHAAELALDPARLAVAGDSAGGGLAAMACQALRGSAVALRAQVLFYPGTDLSPGGDAFPSRRRNGAVPPLTLELMQAMSGPFLSSGLDPRDPRLSPLQAADVSGLPPALVFTAECDALLDDGRLYADALRTAGVPVEYVELPGMVHGFIEMAGVLPAAVQAIERSGAFLRERLA